MRKLIGVVLAGLLLAGCTTQPARTLYLKTEMQTPVSGPNTVTVQADKYQKSANTRHAVLYAMQPLPGYDYRDELDRKFVAANMFIDYVPGAESNTVEISGDIAYYERLKFNNARLIGDVTRSFPVLKTTLTLTKGKPVIIELPRGIKYSVELTEQLD